MWWMTLRGWWSGGVAQEAAPLAGYGVYLSMNESAENDLPDGDGGKSPALAVLVLTYNHERYIAACLESVLGIGYPNLHLWVLDDGSSDRTLDEITRVAEGDARVTVLTQPNSGGRTAANTQRLLDESSGEYVMFMSGDDMLGPCFPVMRSITALEADADLAMVLPRLLFLMQNPGLPAPHIYRDDFLDALRSGDPEQVLERHLYRQVSRIFLQGLIVRRSVINAAGGFDEDLLADDYAFNMRLYLHLAEIGQRFLFDARSLWLYRVHDTNVHRSAPRQFRLVLEVLLKYVPDRYWESFRWDMMAFESLQDLAEASDAVQVKVAHVDTTHLIRRLERTTLSDARRNGNVAMLRNAVSDRRLHMRNRLKACLYLLRAQFSRR